ncbi:MAG: antitoxin [Candidatus Lokiarchaeota archaeon]|nr:antitoxin [Candidatus Lokiarchaeota archaeon]
MTTKTITIREEAYRVLKNLKLENESFSDTILRISKLFSNLKESWGQGTKDDSEYEEELQKLEESRNIFFQGRI